MPRNIYEHGWDPFLPDPATLPVGPGHFEMPLELPARAAVTTGYRLAVAALTTALAALVTEGLFLYCPAVLLALGPGEKPQAFLVTLALALAVLANANPRWAWRVYLFGLTPVLVFLLFVRYDLLFFWAVVPLAAVLGDSLVEHAVGWHTAAPVLPPLAAAVRADFRARFKPHGEPGAGPLPVRHRLYAPTLVATLAGSLFLPVVVPGPLRANPAVGAYAPALTVLIICVYNLTLPVWFPWLCDQQGHAYRRLVRVFLETLVNYRTYPHHVRPAVYTSPVGDTAYRERRLLVTLVFLGAALVQLGNSFPLLPDGPLPRWAIPPWSCAAGLQPQAVAPTATGRLLLAIHELLQGRFLRLAALFASLLLSAGVGMLTALSFLFAATARQLALYEDAFPTDDPGGEDGSV